jgi:hypothetical protein
LKNFSRFSHSKSTECTISNNSLINFWGKLSRSVLLESF